jgi:hypothetical protein
VISYSFFWAIQPFADLNRWYVDVPSQQTDLAQLGIPAIPDRNAR